jgi:molybdopterin-guanine dinucleotide biosynthesis protein A
LVNVFYSCTRNLKKLSLPYCLKVNVMDRSAVILAFSNSSLSEDKGLWDMNGKPLIGHTVDSIKAIVDEVVVIVDSQARADAYAKVVAPNTKFAIDPEKMNNPVAAALTGLKTAQGDYVMFLPYDSPFISKDIALLLFECGIGKSATVPRTPDCEVEAFHAVYRRSVAVEAAEKSVSEGISDLEVMVEHMRGVRYISTMVIEELDPELKTFIKINSPMDSKRLANIGKPKPSKKTKTFR